MREKPAGYPVMRQRWADLLFLHWRVPVEVVVERLPEGLHVDVFDGSAWLGVVPFFMDRVRPVLLPPVPGISWFMELNVRTYVHDDYGNPGVWFFSLDCNQPLAVEIARRAFHLPYEHAAMQAVRSAGRIYYACRREVRGRPRRDRWNGFWWSGICFIRQTSADASIADGFITRRIGLRRRGAKNGLRNRWAGIDSRCRPRLPSQCWLRSRWMCGCFRLQWGDRSISGSVAKAGISRYGLLPKFGIFLKRASGSVEAGRGGGDCFVEDPAAAEGSGGGSGVGSVCSSVA